MWSNNFSGRGSYLQGGVVDSAASHATDVAAGAGSNAKGAWVEMIASTERPVCGLWVQLQKSTQNDSDYLVDIGIGVIGSEMAILPNLLFCAGPSSLDPGGTITNYYFPIQLPAGIRVSARAQCSASGSRVVRVRTWAIIGTWYDQPYRQVIDIGINTGDSGATSITPDTVASPAWYELTPSLSKSIRGFVMAFGKQAIANGPIGRLVRCEIGVGAVSSEIVIATYFTQFIGGFSGNIEPPTTPFLPIAIPKDTRVSARMRVSFAVSDLYDVALYGMVA